MISWNSCATGMFFWVGIDTGRIENYQKITEVGNSELGWGWVTSHSKGPKDTVLETCIASCMATKIWWKIGCGLQTSLPKLWKQWMFIACILLVDFFQASTKYQWIGFWQNWKLNPLLLPLYLYLSIHVCIYIYIRCSLLSHRFSHPVLGHTEVNACEVSQQWLHTLQLLQTIDQTELARAAKMWVVVPKFDHLKRLMLVKEFHKPSPSHHHVYRWYKHV